MKDTTQSNWSYKVLINIPTISLSHAQKLTKPPRISTHSNNQYRIHTLYYNLANKVKKLGPMFR